MSSFLYHFCMLRLCFCLGSGRMIAGSYEKCADNGRLNKVGTVNKSICVVSIETWSTTICFLGNFCRIIERNMLFQHCMKNMLDSNNLKFTKIGVCNLAVWIWIIILQYQGLQKVNRHHDVGPVKQTTNRKHLCIIF